MDSRAETGPNGWRRFVAGLPMRTALLAVAVVWLLGCAWSFQEQSDFAAAKGFAFPHLLPLVIDGFAVAMAGVSWAASLDARPAVPARLATLVAVAGSAASNGAWAWIRTGPAPAAAGVAGAVGHDRVAVALGVAVPVAANLAFEVLLAELRRQVQRRRGLSAPVAIPYPRLIRVALAPWSTVREWRRLVLEITELAPLPAEPEFAETAAAHPAASGVLREASPAHHAERLTTIEAAAPAADIVDQVRREPDTAPVPAQPHRSAPLTLLTVPADDVAAGPAAAAAAAEVGGSSVDMPDERVQLLVELLRQGRPLTGAAAAAEVGCSPRTGRRLLSEAKELTKMPA